MKILGKWLLSPRRFCVAIYTKRSKLTITRHSSLPNSVSVCVRNALVQIACHACTDDIYRLIVICAYINDKRVATSAGRPPTLTRHYCHLQMPLDLTDAQLMSEGMDLEIAVEALDEAGWNQRDMVQRCTFARLAATNAVLTEEILEISLGRLAREEVIQRAAQIEAKTNKSWAELPDFLRIDIEDPWNSARSPLELLYLITIRLGHLEHKFLLQRTLNKTVESGLDNPNIKLLSVCDELFRFILLLVDNKDYFRDFQSDFVSILAVHGVPTAAVLAVELLHQERQPTAASTMAYPLHRSNMIQHLSVFVSCLGSIRNEAYGSQSCDRGRKFLKKILDTILGPGPAVSTDNSSSVAWDDLGDPMRDASLLQAGSDVDFVRWLDNMEWDQDAWVNFN